VKPNRQRRPMEVGPDESSSAENSFSPAVEAEGLVKTFGGVVALEGISFELYAGEVVALAGENGAGKSTLKNLLAGVVRPDEGRIAVNGETVTDAAQARRLGVAAIHQELSLYPSMSVAENVLITSLGGRRNLFVNPSRLANKVAPLLERVGADFGARELVENLSTGRRQLVEIAKALAENPSVIIFDEPTASLNLAERERVFEVVRQLKADGAAVLYITHHLQEIFDLSDRTIVLRDGRLVDTRPTASLTRAELEALMVGRELSGELPHAPRASGEVALRVRDLDDGGRVSGVSFEVRRGEILGLAGLVGSGRTEVARAVFGLSRTRGTVELDGAAMIRPSPREAIRGGMGFVTEDRRAEGLFVERPIRENLTVVALGRFVRRLLGRVDRKAENRAALERAQDLRIAARGGLEAPVSSLSGGNQQKVVLGKWLEGAPRVLILDEPTRGIDVGAKAEIYRLLVGLAEQGVAILMISSEMAELLGLCHRVGIMHAGRLAGTLGRAEATQEHIIRLATGGTP
jgi:ABC-type sugar transport system ATPase subunit